MTIENELKNKESSIDLSQEELKRKLYYDPDTGIFTRRIGINNRLEGTTAGTEREDGYWSIYINGRRYLRHHLAWFYVYGEWAIKLDHKNQIKGDDWIENLRKATTSQNNMNRPAQINNMLNVKGVRKHGNKFVARIKADRIEHYLGLFNTLEEAVSARQKAESKFFGEFAERTWE